MTSTGLLTVLALFVGQVPPPNAVETASRKLRQEREAILTREASALEALAARLEKAKQTEAAVQIRALAVKDRAPAAGASRFRPLDEIIAPPAKNSAAWAKEFDPIRQRAADELLALAQSALKAEPPRFALADGCLRAVVERSPKAAEAYRLLGYLPHEGGWATPFAIAQLKKGLQSHPVFGWVEKDWIPHLDQGQLPAPHVSGRPTRWLAAKEADQLRREWGKGWQIKTEHFSIVTNVPLSEAISFGKRLEAFHDLFTSLFADVIGTESPLAQLAKNPKQAPTPAKKQHKVFYFADKQEYVRQLLPIQGEAANSSLGTYIPPRLSRPRGNSASYFFRDSEGQIEVTATLYHEVSHQLLFESAGLDRYEDQRPNFWVFEGLGTYFETVTPKEDGSIEYGGLIGPRIEQARIRLIKNREFIPIERFSLYNKSAFNGDTGDGDIYLHYAQAMSLANYLMQAENERFREGFLDHVRDVYKGRTTKTLEDRLGVSFAAINRGILAHLKAEQPAKRPE